MGQILARHATLHAKNVQVRNKINALSVIRIVFHIEVLIQILKNVVVLLDSMKYSTKWLARPATLAVILAPVHHKLSV